jgi:phosphate transport system permease protein
MAFLPLYIYSYAMSGNVIREQKALAAAMVLLTFVMILNVGIRFIAGKRVVLASQGE